MICLRNVAKSSCGDRKTQLLMEIVKEILKKCCENASSGDRKTQKIMEIAMPALKPYFTPSERSGDVFSWDPL